MGLTGILDMVQESPTYQGALATLAAATNGAGPLRVTVPDAARSYLIACLCRDLHRPVLLVTAKPEDADHLSDDLATIFNRDADDAFPVLRLPESEALPYERLAEDAEISHGRLNVLSTLLYLFMGYICLFYINPLLAQLPYEGLIWLISGGAAYTIGVFFYAMDDKIPYNHAIWHACVLFGSFSHFMSVFFYVLPS